MAAENRERDTAKEAYLAESIERGAECRALNDTINWLINEFTLNNPEMTGILKRLASARAKYGQLYEQGTSITYEIKTLTQKLQQPQANQAADNKQDNGELLQQLERAQAKQAELSRQFSATSQEIQDLEQVRLGLANQIQELPQAAQAQPNAAANKPPENKQDAASYADELFEMLANANTEKEKLAKQLQALQAQQHAGAPEVKEAGPNHALAETYEAMASLHDETGRLRKELDSLQAFCATQADENRDLQEKNKVLQETLDAGLGKLVHEEESNVLGRSQFQALKGENAKQAAEIAALKAELALLKKQQQPVAAPQHEAPKHAAAAAAMPLKNEEKDVPAAQQPRRPAVHIAAGSGEAAGKLGVNAENNRRGRRNRGKNKGNNQGASVSKPATQTPASLQ